jgi:hypothetical protein
VYLHSVTENLGDSAPGQARGGILASIAQFYSANVGQEVRKRAWIRRPRRAAGRPKPLPGTATSVRSSTAGKVVTGTDNSRGMTVAAIWLCHDGLQTAAGPPRDTFGRSVSRSAQKPASTCAL